MRGSPPMVMFAASQDGTPIAYERTGEGATALVCVHGWMGNARWWDATRDAFAPTHTVVAMELAGHGRSGPARRPGSAEAYAEDIVAVARAVAAPRTVLVAHSMAGAYALFAAPHVAGLAAIVLVDTVKNLGAVLTLAQVEPMFAAYRASYRDAVDNFLPKFLFSPGTPPDVRARLLAEFAATTGDTAVALLEPLYRADLQTAARAVRVPVRGIGGDLSPHDLVANRAYLADYDYVELARCGHYPMLEQPAAFVAALRAILERLA